MDSNHRPPRCEHGALTNNATTTNVTNARSEGLNSKIQIVKRKACGHRNRKHFHNSIYFHLADLDLYPDSLQSTHTKA